MERDFEEFFRANERRIHFQIHRLGISGVLYDDFYSEGIMAMWEAYREYDPKSGEIGTFVNYRIRFRLLDLMRKLLREQANAEEAVQEKAKLLGNGNRNRGSGMPIPDMKGIQLEDEHFWQEVRAHLSENQWKWVKYFVLGGLTVKEIMEIEGVTADAVKGWGQAVKKKLRKEEVRRKLEGRA